MSSLRTRRYRAAGLLGGLLAASLLLAACSGVADPATSSTGSAPSAATTQTSDAAGSLLPAAEGVTEYPLTLTTPWGETVLSERPERVAALDVTALDAQLLLALGVTPVAAHESGVTFSPYLAADGGDRIEQLLQVSLDPLNGAEAIAASQPDLLLAFGTDLAESYSSLSSIGPVLASSETLESYFDQPWQDQLRLIGHALDLAERAEKVIAEHEQLLQGVIDAHPEFADKTVTYAIWYGSDTDYGLNYASRQGSGAERFFTQIGFVANPLAESFTSEATVSFERRSLLDADVLIVNDSSGGRIDELLEDPLFQQVPVVQRGSVVITADPEDGGRNPVAWALVVQGPLAIEYIVEELVPQIAETLA